MFGIGAQELIVILVIALLVFGPKRLPELARSLGRGLAEFRRASSDLRQSLSVDPPAEPRAERDTRTARREDEADERASLPAQSVGTPEPPTRVAEESVKPGPVGG